MNTQLIIDYLSELSMNNNREWYHANKEDYKKANDEFERLLQNLMLEIGKFDSSILHNNPKDLIFKIVRDTRFSMINRLTIQHSVPIFLLRVSYQFLLDII